MSIWFKDYNLDDYSWMYENTIFEVLGIEFTEKGDDYLKGRMPIDHRTIQPFKILHGGASVTLAESLGSLASLMLINPEEKICVGQSIQANHIRPGTSGYANGTAKLIHKGKSSHIWNIDIVNDEGKLLCICRLTMAIVDKPDI